MSALIISGRNLVPVTLRSLDGIGHFETNKWPVVLRYCSGISYF